MFVSLEYTKLLQCSHCGTALGNILLNTDLGGAVVGTPSVYCKLGLSVESLPAIY